MELKWYTTLVEDAKEEAKEAGMREGRREGIQEGIIKTARNLLKDGIPIEVIERATSLPKEKFK